MVALYKKDSKGKTRKWTIRVGEKDGVFGILTSDGLLNGKMKDEVFKAAEPTNIGKANFRDSKAQAEFLMNSAITKKKRSNYFDSPEDIKEEEILFLPTGCPSGMRWEEWKDKSHVVYPALASAKLDGSKMFSTWREERVFLNTRSAKEFFNFEHIREELKAFYVKNPNIVLDGEAYNHKYAERFEELQSIFKKQKPTDEQRELSKEVSKFYVYDAVDLNRPNLTAAERQVLLDNIFHEWFKDSKYLVKWASAKVISEQDYDWLHEACMDKGFEGTVLKISSAPYVQRKNKFVMKRKPQDDAEFEIVDIIEGTGTTAGIAGKMIINLRMNQGLSEEYKAKLAQDNQEAGMAKGWNHKMLKEMLENKYDYIGKMGTFQFGGLTGYGKLRFPKFKALRNGID